MQNYVITWESAVDIVNFPNAKTTYDVNIEVFEDASPTKRPKKFSLVSEIPYLDLSHYLYDVPPYTRFKVIIRSKTNWAMSREIAVKIFYTSGTSASKPKNFRVFWYPIEKVNTLQRNSTIN